MFLWLKILINLIITDHQFLGQNPCRNRLSAGVCQCGDTETAHFKGPCGAGAAWRDLATDFRVKKLVDDRLVLGTSAEAGRWDVVDPGSAGVCFVLSKK